jgi:hypothetical protein
MAATIPNLWPDDISIDVLPPLALLRTQASLLNKITKGILEAEVTTATNHESEAVQHQLDLIAPALDGYRYRLLTAKHQKDLLYPVTVEAACFPPVEDEYIGEDSYSRQADTQQEFMKLVGQVLRSGEVRSVIQSLIARTNEERTESPVAENADTS